MTKKKAPGRDWNDVLRDDGEASIIAAFDSAETIRSADGQAAGDAGEATAQASGAGGAMNVVQFPTDLPDPYSQAVRVLGHNRGRYAYYSPHSKQVWELTVPQHTEPFLETMAPARCWPFQFRSANGRMRWKDIGTDLRERAHRAGIYRPDRVRGRGAWRDGIATVMNLGNKLLIDGLEREFHEHRLAFVYEAGETMKLPAIKSPLRGEEAGEVLEIAKQFRWAHSVSAYLLSGWCVMAPVCGALSWRPHIWVTGGSGTGKTTVMNDFIKPLIGPEPWHLHVQGTTTEPGIRHLLQNDALPVIFDEAESNDIRSKERISAVLELMRGASSQSGAKTAKGGAPGQGAKTYDVRSMFALVAVNPGVSQQADVSRIGFLTLLPPVTDTIEQREAAQEHWEKLSENLSMFTEEFTLRLLARTISMLPTILHNVKTFETAVALELGTKRLGQQLGTLLAGAYSLRRSDLVDVAAARKFVSEQDWADFMAGERDEMLCLRHLLHSTIDVEMEDARVAKRLVGEVVAIAHGALMDTKVGRDHARRALARHGLKVDGTCLLVANSHRALKTVFAPTPYSDWPRQLSRLSFFAGVKAGTNFLSIDPTSRKDVKDTFNAAKLVLQDVLALL